MKTTTNHIWTNIKTLLHQHDCVIVPGFGGFVCNREPAKIDQVSHIITPPARKVVFNQNLKTNDGLLAGFLVQQLNISYSQALLDIENTVQQTLQILQDNKSLTIDLFGDFRLNADANYVFLPDKRNNYLTNSYGLGMIQSRPVNSRNIHPKKIRVFKDTRKVTTLKPSRNIWPKALAGVLVILLSINGYIFFQNSSLSDGNLTETNTMSITSWFDSLLPQPTQSVSNPVIAPLTETSEVQTTKPLSNVKIDAASDPITSAKNTHNLEEYASLYAFAAHYQHARSLVYFPQQFEELPIVDTQLPNETPAVNELEIPAHLNTEGIAKGFYVIGGVFCKERNARRFLSLLNTTGFTNAEILVNTSINCKRVSYKKFASLHDAENFCEEIKNTDNPMAWVLTAN